MNKRTVLIYLSLFILGLTATYTWLTPAAYGQVATIPTRTPTPGAGQPTAVPTSSNPNPTQAPQNTAVPTALPTATDVPVTIAPTPVGGIMPTAEPCSDVPTILAINSTFVRSGPGTDYETVAQLVYQEVRPIFGRAADAQWWFIQLADGRTGWVADQVVIVAGNAGYVPVVAAPLLNGAAPTAGPLWNPTPNPQCPVTPTPTPTNTPLPTTESVQAVVPEATAGSSGGGANKNVQVVDSASGVAAAKAEDESADTAVSDTAVQPTITPIVLAENAAAPAASDPLPTAAPLAAPQTAESSSNAPLLLFGGITLVLIVIGVVIAKRRTV